MSEPIKLYNAQTGGLIVMYAPNEARRMIDSGKYTMIAPVEPEPTKPTKKATK
jgi:hypothetical protein